MSVDVQPDSLSKPLIKYTKWKLPFHVLVLIYNITSITIFCHLAQILLQHNISLFSLDLGKLPQVNPPGELSRQTFPGKPTSRISPRESGFFTRFYLYLHNNKLRVFSVTAFPLQICHLWTLYIWSTFVSNVISDISFPKYEKLKRQKCAFFKYSAWNKS